MTQTLESPPKAGNGNAGNLPAVASRLKFEPLAPIGSAGALKSLLETQSRGIADALPKHITPERLIKTMLVAANRTPDLLKCTQASIIETINRAAELGLDLSGTLGEAYPVPFNNKVKTSDGDKWVTQCQLIIGYRGFVKLARQSGEVKRIDADVVCENDHFEFRKGSNAKCEFVPNFKEDRGEPIGAYAYVQFKDGGEQFDFMPVHDIEKVRMRSKSGSVQKDNAYGKQGDPMGAWKSDWAEMAKKTVFRRLAKWLPMSTEKFVEAIEHDNNDVKFDDVIEVARIEREGGSRAKQLADELRSRKQIDQSTGEVTAPATGQQTEASESSQNDSATAGQSGAEDQTTTASDDDQSKTSNNDESQTGPSSDEAARIKLIEAIEQGPDEFKKTLLKVARTVDANLPKQTFEGGIFKYVQQHGNGKPAEVSQTDWISLHDAIVSKRFVYPTGLITE